MKTVLQNAYDTYNVIRNRPYWRGLYFLTLFTLSVLVVTKARPFWDMLPYMGTVVSLDTSDPDLIHATTYTEFKKHAGEQMMSAMLAGDDFTETMHRNPSYFSQQLPFFKVKVIYVFICRLFSKMGVPLFYAVLIPSALALFFTGFIFFTWLHKHYSALFSSAISLSLLMVFFNLDTFRIASPDALCGAFILASAYFLVVRDSLRYYSVFAFLAVFTRPDTIFLFIVMACLLGVYNFKNARILYPQLLSAVLAIALLYMVQKITGYNSYKMFYRSFVHLVPNPEDLDLQFELNTYLSGLKTGLLMSLNRISLYVFLALLVYCFLKREEFADIKVIWLEGLLISFIVKLIFHPLIDDRFLFIYIDIMILFMLTEFKKGFTFAEQPRENIVSWQ